MSPNLTRRSVSKTITGMVAAAGRWLAYNSKKSSVLVPWKEIEHEATRHRNGDMCVSNRASATAASQFTSARPSLLQMAAAGDSGQTTRDA